MRLPPSAENQLLIPETAEKTSLCERKPFTQLPQRLEVLPLALCSRPLPSLRLAPHSLALAFPLGLTGVVSAVFPRPLCGITPHPPSCCTVLCLGMLLRLFFSFPNICSQCKVKSHRQSVARRVPQREPFSQVQHRMIETPVQVRVYCIKDLS